MQKERNLFVLRTQYDQCKKVREQIRQTNRRLKDLNELTAHSDNLDKVIQSYQASIQRKQQRKKELIEKRDELKLEQTNVSEMNPIERDRNINNLKLEIDEIRAKQGTKLFQFQKLMEEVKQLEEDIGDIKDEVQAYQTHIQKEQEKKKGLVKKRDELKIEQTNVSEMNLAERDHIVNKLKIEIDELMTKHGTKLFQFQKLMEEVKQLEEELQENADEIKAKQRNIQKIESAYIKRMNIVSKINQINNGIMEIDESISTLNQSHKKQLEILNLMKTDLEPLIEEKLELYTKKNALRTEERRLFVSKQTITELEKNINQLKKQAERSN